MWQRERAVRRTAHVRTPRQRPRVVPIGGIGEAGAIALLNQFGTVEQIYDRFAEVPNRYKKPLDGQREAAEFSKKLATIVCDVPVSLDLKAATLHDYDRTQVIGLFQELEIGTSLIKRLPASGDAFALADLPGIEGARIYEPEPERVYAWTR